MSFDIDNPASTPTMHCSTAGHRRVGRGALLRSVLATLVLLVSIAIAYSDWSSHRRQSEILAAQGRSRIAEKIEARIEAGISTVLAKLRAASFAFADSETLTAERFAAWGTELHASADGLPIIDMTVGTLDADRVVIQARWSPLSESPSQEADAALTALWRATRPQSGRLATAGSQGSDGTQRITFAYTPNGRQFTSATVDVDTWLRTLIRGYEGVAHVRVSQIDANGKAANPILQSGHRTENRVTSSTVDAAGMRWHTDVTASRAEPSDPIVIARVVATIALGGTLSLLIALFGYRHDRARWRAARSLKEAAERDAHAQRIASLTKEGSWEFDCAERRLYCAPYLLNMLQLEKDRHVGMRDLLRTVAASERRSVLDSLRSALRTGGLADVTVRAELRNGDKRCLRVRASATTDQAGSVLLTGAISELSEAASAHLGAERYRQFLVRVLDAIPAPIVVKNARLQILMANHAFAEVNRTNAHSLVGAHAGTFVDDDSRERLEALDRAVFADAAPQTAAFWTTDKRGEERFRRVTKSLCDGPDGEPVVVTTFEDLTQLSEQEQQQSRLRAFLQEVFDAVPHPLFVKDAQHRYIMTNRAHAESLGRTVDDVIGRTSRDLASAELAQAIEQAEVALFNEGGDQVVENEYILRDPSGRPRNTIVRKAACHDADGRRVIVGINTDITALRETERDLRRTLRRFAALIENAPLAIVLMDEYGNFLDANPFFREMTGYSSVEAKRLNHRNLSPEREQLLVDQKAAELYAKGYCAPFEKRYLRRNGTEVSVMVTAVLVKIEGEPTQIWGLAQDMTEHNAALAALRESETRWQFALEGSGDGVWDWHTDTQTAYFSPRWKAMLGYSDDEIGSDLSDWRNRVHPDDLTRVTAAMAAHLSGNAPIFVSEYRMLCKNGEYRWILDRGKIIERDDKGDPLRLIGTLTDITASKDVEEELRRHRDGLKDLVQEQTAHLLRAKEAAERASEAKSVFLANMSHELRTPMHAILSFARLGESRYEQASPEKLRDYFARILTSGERLMSLLNDLLDLSKLEAGRMSLELKPVRLLDIAYEVATEYEAWLKAKRLKFVVSASPDLPRVLADGARVGQVMRNLLSNAAKFSPDGASINLDLRLARLPSGRRADDRGDIPAVEFAIADQGQGIPPVELESVFEKFVQSSMTKTGAGGTGLGLAICREIVDAHRGQIFARNRELGGAEFVVRLPAEGVPPQWIAEEEANY